MTASDRIWVWKWHLPGSKFHGTHAWCDFKPFWPDRSEFNFRKMRWEKVPQKQQDFTEYARVRVEDTTCDTIAKSSDFVSLPRAEVEALMDEVEWAKGVLHRRLTHPNDEGYLSGFDAALAALQERMK